MKQNLNIFFVCCVLVESAFWCYGQDFFEFLGPRLGYDNSKLSEPDNEKVTERQVTKYGYPFETHTVITNDGYIITMHRIPYGKNETNDTTPRPVFLVHPGAFGSTDVFVLQGPEYDFAFYMVDAGYDLWFYNCRGNVYSRKHTHLNPDKDPEFWDFSMHEVGLYDLPACIDYVLNITNQEDLFLTGHSLGGYTPLIMLSLLPEYNSKVRLFMALHTAAELKHKITPLQQILTTFLRDGYPLLKSQKIYELLPRRKLVNHLFGTACTEGSQLFETCRDLLASQFGENFGPENMNISVAPHVFSVYPCGSSAKLTYSVAQLLLSGDYATDVLGISRDDPPFYNLTKVTVPVTLHFSDNDPYAGAAEANGLCAKLGNCAGKYRVRYPKQNHVDLLVSKNAKRSIFPKMVRLMKKYSKKRNVSRQH